MNAKPMAKAILIANSIAVSIVIAIGFAASAARGAVEIVPLVRSADLGPGGDGTYGSYLDYGPPCINDDGQVAFSADLGSNAGGTAADELMVRVEADGAVTILAREGSAIPDGTGFYDNLKYVVRRYVMNNDGRVAFVSEMTGTPGGTTDNQAIWSSDGPGTEVEHVRIGDPAPGTAATFSGFFAPTINNMSPVGIAFYAYAGGFGAHPGHIFTNRAGTSTLIAKVTDPVPGDGGTLYQFDENEPVSIEPDDVNVAFRSQLTGTPYASEDDAAIYKASGGALTQIMRGRQPVPGGGVNYDEPYYPTMNVAGKIAFRAVLRPTSSGDVIVIASGAVVADRVVMTNDLHPDGISQFASLYNPALSAGNVAAFRANLKNTPLGGLDDEGIYRGDGTLLIEVAREGQAVPEGGGEFAFFGSTVAINTQGQVLFTARLRGTPYGTADNDGLYLWDELTGITKLVRTRDTVPGSGTGKVTDILALSACDYNGFRSLNDASEAVAILNTEWVAGLGEKDGVYLFRVTDTSDVGDGATQTRLLLSPNPWLDGALSIRFAEGGVAPSGIEIFDISGRRLRRLESQSGYVEWDGFDRSGRLIPSGTYFVRTVRAADAGGARIGEARLVRLIR